jgi:hypothetical protein
MSAPESWADCSVGADPTKNGGDLLWAEAWASNQCHGGFPPFSTPLFAVGPTGDIGLGINCGTIGLGARANGWGNVFFQDAYQSPSSLFLAALGPHNDLLLHQDATYFTTTTNQLDLYPANGSPGCGWTDVSHPLQSLSVSFDSPTSDALGNLFSLIKTDHAAQLNASFQLPAPGSYLARGGPLGQSYLAGITGKFVPDQQGGVYLYGALTSAIDFGCGPMSPSSPDDSYLVHLDASWSCVFHDILPAVVGVTAAPDGGVLLDGNSPAALDLGCGALPVAPGGNTQVARLDSAGACLFGASFAAPSLAAAFDPTGRVVVSGLVDTPDAIDLGGGPLAPQGAPDLVIAELDVDGTYLWSGRYGGPGVSFSGPTIALVASGDLHVLTGYSGAVDFGGGPVSAAAGDRVVASFTSAGAHRWSRAIHIIGANQAAIDGCGALVVVSTDRTFDPGCGPVIPPPSVWPFAPLPYVGIARFAP